MGVCQSEVWIPALLVTQLGDPQNSPGPLCRSGDDNGTSPQVWCKNWMKDCTQYMRVVFVNLSIKWDVSWISKRCENKNRVFSEELLCIQCFPHISLNLHNCGPKEERFIWCDPRERTYWNRLPTVNRGLRFYYKWESSSHLLAGPLTESMFREQSLTELWLPILCPAFLSSESTLIKKFLPSSFDQWTETCPILS